VTERLYYHDATLLSFDASVVAHAGDAHRVVLDRTAFYPTSGGQPHDTGMLGGARVTDVIDAAAGIVHVLDTPLPLGTVHGEVDAARRRDHMQQHTAQHLISALAADRHGWHTESVHFGDDHSAIEFDATAATDDQLRDLAAWANAVVEQAVPVTVTFEDATTATGLRKPSDRGGEIRIIAIDGIDRSACGGTHVSRTSEIGAIMITGSERVRTRTRVGFLAGHRTLSRLQEWDRLIHHVAAASSCAIDELAELVPRRLAQLADATARLEALEREVAGLRVDQLVAAQPPSPDGLRRVVYRGPEADAAMLRAMAQAVGALDRVVFVATTASPPSVVFGASADSGVDAGARVKAALAATGGRGGGSPRFAQGAAPSAAHLRTIVEQLLA
jgi:alanyl-tRNA synthetase